MKTQLLGLAGLVMFTASVSADLIDYDFSWTGSNGYTMTGIFSFDDSLLDTGPIDGSQIDSIMLEVFHNGDSLGVWDSASGQDPGANVLNFNFDTTTESLLIGGHSASSTLGQEWNWVSPTGVGFGSGESLQAVVVSGSTLGAISTNNSTLTAKRKFHAVPEPNIAIAWTVVGLISAGLYRRRR